ncbi:MAG: response regulator transcription factor [Syntrophales bacterium]|nr:response regulator transcription factor [Syntrophales bacterium]MCK9528031.1 response regulator transcription factor [Syntrophales bacterium]MDX9921392.1 response regulator transcription factor [Syntrophales bacterium]
MSINILIADDHVMFREGLTLLIERDQEMKVVGQATNGREAVTMARKLTPPIVLMDINMPRLSGIGATEIIKRTLPNVNVIMLSMYSTEEHVFRSLNAGAKGYLLKDLAGKEVLKAIRTVNAGKTYLCRQISSIVIDEYVKHRAKNNDSGSLLSILSQREYEVLRLVVEGYPSKKIADSLCIANSTADTYRHRIMKKLGASSNAELIKLALQNGLIPMDTNL